MSNSSESLWLIGCGKMAIEYAKVLENMGIPFQAIGRGIKSTQEFSKSVNVEAHAGGLKKILTKEKAPKNAIVATNIEELAIAAGQLTEAGCENILIEKPGALYQGDLINLHDIGKKKNANIYIAYNRRFYSSVIELKNC